ncbi:MAG TPA: thiol reductase thioredoxin [Anaeromyxobacteraceae bacterium]|nr:thiol reductase thioredoxin [Anaeromyxobacteraceae bacterium]
MTIYRCAGCGAVNEASPPQAPLCTRCRRALDVSGRPQVVDAAALVSAIRSSPAPVLVDFSAPGERTEALDRVAGEQAGRLLVLRVDPGAQPAAAEAYAVWRGPTWVLFSGGAEIARRRGVPCPVDVAAWVATARAARPRLPGS